MENVEKINLTILFNNHTTSINLPMRSKLITRYVLHHNHVLKNNLVTESGEKYGIL